MEFRTPLARRTYDEVVAQSARGVVCLDFDGTLSPIVDEPDEAKIHPEAGDALVALGAQFQAVAVVTGRPARQVLALGDLDAVGNRIAEQGGRLMVLGQYGNERWTTDEPRVRSPRPPRGLASFMSELPQLLKDARASDAHLEEKGLAVAVHTRRLPDPQEAFERLKPLLARGAQRHGLVLEPGRLVIEVRAPGMDKGAAVRSLQKELRADAMVFGGDDLGDLEAFEAIRALRRGGMVGLLVCSGSDEQPALVEMADVLVHGPDGVIELLRQMAKDAAASADPSRHDASPEH
jgi:trehalose 6-phosphate phosphatase